MCAVAYARLRCTLRPLTIPYPAPLSPHRAHNTQRSQSSQHFLSFSLYASRSLEPAPWCSGPNQSTLYSLSRLNAPAGRRAPVISTLPRSRLPRLGLGARGGRTACCFVSHVHAGQPDECFLWHILHPTRGRCDGCGARSSAQRGGWLAGALTPCSSRPRPRRSGGAALFTFARASSAGNWTLALLVAEHPSQHVTGSRGVPTAAPKIIHLILFASRLGMYASHAKSEEAVYVCSLRAAARSLG